MPPISQTALENALGQYLLTMAGVPEVAWANRNVDPDRPFLAVEHVPGPRTDPTLDGTGETVEGVMMINVVIEENQFATPANELVDDVVAHFAYKTKVSFSDGVVLVTKPPEVLTGYKDGPDYRVPVRVDYTVQT